ncbi:MAG: hypothetical protein SVJ22_09230 [Halobacteriota archaeon]|nr:hypothetical protein [Halobacteriota archaeon]
MPTRTRVQLRDSTLGDILHGHLYSGINQGDLEGFGMGFMLSS